MPGDIAITIAWETEGSSAEFDLKQRKVSMSADASAARMKRERSMKKELAKLQVQLCHSRNG